MMMNWLQRKVKLATLQGVVAGDTRTAPVSEREKDAIIQELADALEPLARSSVNHRGSYRINDLQAKAAAKLLRRLKDEGFVRGASAPQPHT